MDILPVLYKKNKKGNILYWSIYIEDNEDTSIIIVEHGILNGKIKKSISHIKKGKNIGKINETTCIQQAKLEAKSKWNSKIDEGYYENIDNKVLSNKKPMLAVDYFKYSKHVVFPCFTQRKYDGVRALYTNGVFTSRGGKTFDLLNHIKEELENTSSINHILDGELYSYSLTFQEIVGLVRKKKLSKQDEEKMKEIVYVIYDIIIDGEDYINRSIALNKIFKNNELKSINIADIDICNDATELKGLHDSYVKDKYEGMIIRNFKGLYEPGVRSFNLQKYKVFDDDEFEIIGFKDGKGIEEKTVIWKCINNKGLEFDVHPRGSHEERRTLYINADKYIGKLLTVRYFGFTDIGIPRFPIGISIRDYE